MHAPPSGENEAANLGAAYLTTYSDPPLVSVVYTSANIRKVEIA